MSRKPVAYIYGHHYMRGIPHIATVLPSILNCHLPVAGWESFWHKPLYLPGALSAPARPWPHVYAWKTPAMEGWAVGYRPPTPMDSYYRKYPEKFEDLTIVILELESKPLPSNPHMKRTLS